MNPIPINSETDALRQIIRILNEPQSHSWHKRNEIISIANQGLSAAGHHVGTFGNCDFKSWPDSSTIISTGYLLDTETLTIKFNNGTTYEYLNVKLPIWDELKRCASIGKFFGSHINKQYEFKQIL